MPAPRRVRFDLVYLVLAVAVMLGVQWWQAARTTEVLPYSEFVRLLDEGRIAEVTLTEHQVLGKLKKPEGDARRGRSGGAEAAVGCGARRPPVRRGMTMRAAVSPIGQNSRFPPS